MLVDLLAVGDLKGLRIPLEFLIRELAGEAAQENGLGGGAGVEEVRDRCGSLLADDTLDELG